MRIPIAFVRAMLAAACILMSPASRASTVAASVEAGTERAPDDFSHAVLNYDIATVTATYDSGFTWSGQLQNSRPTNGDAAWLVEGMVGYRYAYSPSLSLYGNAGAGERMTPAREFPYLTVRLGADKAFGARLVWNMVNLRYRDGLDPDVAYHSAVVGTGLTYRVDDAMAFYTRVFAAFDTRYRFAGTGFGVGLKRYF